jgi:hypothetical protein
MDEDVKIVLTVILLFVGLIGGVGLASIALVKLSMIWGLF